MRVSQNGLSAVVRVATSMLHFWRTTTPRRFTLRRTALPGPATRRKDSVCGTRLRPGFVVQPNSASAAMKSTTHWPFSSGHARLPATRRRRPRCGGRWIERAVELAPLDSRARAEALVARAFWHRPDSGAADDAREGATIAERLRAVDVLSYAFSARALAALASSDYAEAEEATRRRLALLPELSDPDHQADVYWSAMVVYTALGRLAEARRVARLNDEINSLLTAHHRVHGVAARARVDELCGRWHAIRELQWDAESRVAANVDTPCSDNVFCLLVCALARAELGDEGEAARLERAADELGFEGYVGDLAGPRIRLALRRGELGRVEDLLVALQEAGLRGLPSLTTRAARIDGLVALGRATEVEEEGEALVVSPYLEPFALRALAVAKDDPALLERAMDRFAALQLHWHAAQTPLWCSVGQ